MCIVGSITELGKWEQIELAKMKCLDGVWMTDIRIGRHKGCFMYKYIIMQPNKETGDLELECWEQGYNRIFDLFLKDKEKNSPGYNKNPKSDYLQEDRWEEFSVRLTIHYPPPNRSCCMQINSGGKRGWCWNEKRGPNNMTIA
jgi:hypothetical protein